MHRYKAKNEIQEGEIYFNEIDGDLESMGTKIYKKPVIIIKEQEEEKLMDNFDDEIKDNEIDINHSPIHSPIHTPIHILPDNMNDMDDMDDFYIPNINVVPVVPDVKDPLMPDDLINDSTYKDSVALYNLRHKTNILYEKNKITIESNKRIYYFDKGTKLEPGDIPDVDILIFADKYNFKVKRGTIPPGIKKIVFGVSFNKGIEKGALPDGLEILEFKCDFNLDLVVSHSPRIETESYVCVLPPNLKKLILGPSYNREIKSDSLPESLETLVLTQSFNKRMKYFPPNLQCLELGTGYQHMFREGELPRTLTHLILADRYNQEFKKGVLPLTLTHLKIGDGYDQQFKRNVYPQD
jgi:hypothetical protein